MLGKAAKKATPWLMTSGLVAITQDAWNNGMQRVADPNGIVYQTMQHATEYAEPTALGLAGVAIWRAASALDEKAPKYMAGLGQVAAFGLGVVGVNLACSYTPTEGVTSLEGMTDTMIAQAKYSAQELKNYIPGQQASVEKAPAVSVGYLGLACATAKYGLHMAAGALSSLGKKQEEVPNGQAQPV